MEGKDRFFRVYADLPIDIRNETIVIVEDKPITWNVAYDEIGKETELGEKILKKIIEMGLI